MNQIGKNIKLRREELGMSQEELANKLGYKSKSTINKVELGINDITQSKVVEYAKVLDTTISYLMGWDEKTAEIEITKEAKEVGEIMKKYSQLSSSNRMAVSNLINNLLDSQ